MSTENSTPSTLLGSLPPGTQLHEYRIERVLGHGGFGITYLARDINLDKRVAIKEFLPNDIAARAPDQTVSIRSKDSAEAFKWGLDSFIKEARVLGKFSHPSLIPVHRFFEGNNTAYFVMEFAEGVTLGTVLKHEGTMDEERLRRILLPILNGLEEVHTRNVLHRDIKPDNIIMREGAPPVLIDFGAARQNITSMTKSIMSVLTAGYAPIEQYATGGNQGPWTDLYALGAVAYRAISGAKPTDAINRIRNDPLVPTVKLGAGKYSPEFLKAIDWALAVEPEDRPANVAALRAALEGKAEAKAHPPREHNGPTISAMGGTLPPEIASPEANTVITQKRALEDLAPAAAPSAPAGDGKSWLPWVGVAAALAAVAGATVYFGMRGGTGHAPTPPEQEPLPIAAPPQVATTPAPGETKPAQAPSAAPKPPAPAVAQAPQPTTAPEQKPSAPPAAAPSEPVTQPRPEVKPAEPAPAPVPAPESKPAVAAPRNAVAQMAPQSSFEDCANCPTMIVLPAGSFQMGATAADNGNAWEGPSHTVSIARPIAMGRHEVTVGQWRACVEAKACPAVGLASGDAAKAPVVNVSWADARAYAAWLTNTTGRHYRLPSESEWEYAIRAKTTSARYWGGDRTKQCTYGNGADLSAIKFDPKLEPVAVKECDDGHAALAAVGSFQPNAWGLFDMAGNAWEWTEDCWAEGYAGAPTNGSALESGSCDKRSIRGGSWRARPNSLRSFGRGNSSPGVRGDDLGLRVVAE
jgi:formylglycine-generating enzyme required for sulfatase activity/serine/threonine protein kinase